MIHTPKTTICPWTLLMLLQLFFVYLTYYYKWNTLSNLYLSITNFHLKLFKVHLFCLVERRKHFSKTHNQIYAEMPVPSNNQP